MLIQPGLLMARHRRASAPPAFVPGWPASNDLANITRDTRSTGAVTSWQPLSSVAVADGSAILFWFGLSGGGGAPTLDTATSGTDWTHVVNQIDGSGRLLWCHFWFNNTGSSQNRNLKFDSFANRQARGVVQIVPRSQSGAILTAQGVGANIGFGSSIDPPSLDVGASRKCLWVAAGTFPGNQTKGLSGAPTNYSQLQDLTAPASVSTAAHLFTSERLLEAQTENPAAYSNSGSANSVAATVAVWETN